MIVGTTLMVTGSLCSFKYTQLTRTYTRTSIHAPFLNICNKFESRLGVNNSSIFCSEGLVERLTGRKLVLEHIRSVAGQS